MADDIKCFPAALEYLERGQRPGLEIMLRSLRHAQIKKIETRGYSL